MKRKSYSIHAVDGILEATVHQPLSDVEVMGIQKERPMRLRIAGQSGWTGKNLEFLRGLPFIKELIVVELRHLDDVSAIQHLRSLRLLRLFTYAKGPFDMSSLASLREASLIWNRRFSGISGCTRLQHLHVEKLTQEGMEELVALRSLKNLDFMDTRVRSVGAVWKLRQLEKLRIALAPYLTDAQFSGVSRLRGLHQLVLQTCRRLTTLSPIGKCVRLRKLVVEDCGAVESLKPLAALKDLRELYMPGTTDVTDGDLSVVLALPRLTAFAAANRQHYVPPTREVATAIESRVDE
jgi:hypothetical protein